MTEKTIDGDSSKKVDDNSAASDDTGKGGKENLVEKDTSKFTEEQKDDYIDKLKDENAQRRIENRKVTDKLQAQEKSMGELRAELDEAKKTLSEMTAKEKEKADAEKSEIERLTSKMSELEENIRNSRAELDASKSAIAERDLRIQKTERETMVDRLIFHLKHEFSSDFERDGFMASLLRMENGDFVLNDEEVIHRVNKFVKENSNPPRTPGGSPPNKMNETPIAEEIKQLISISKTQTLTIEQSQRLDELLELAGQT